MQFKKNPHRIPPKIRPSSGMHSAPSHSATLRSAALLSASVLSAALLSGCAGPSTRILPRERAVQAYEMPEETQVLEEVNPFYLQEELNILTASPRPSGSRAESDASRYMQRLLQDYGYDVERQRFRYEYEGEMVTGSNVVAVRQAPSPDADILIVSTHHDTEEGSPGANHNASGVATMLETARLLSRLPTDTEIRYISFAGHEADQLGARHYMESLSKRERERMIGAVDLNALGYVSDDQIVLGTLDGEATMLGDMLGEASRDVLGESWGYGKRPEGSVSAFVAGQIPSVSVGQRREAFEKGTPLDTAETVDIERVSQVVDVVSRMVSQVMSPDTPSMTAKAHFYNDLWDYAFVQKRDTPIPFGGSRQEAERTLGIHGALAATNTDASGRLIEKYQYRMKWFDVDQVILTDYYFTDGKLDTVSLDADGAGADFEDMKERLSDMYGEPVGVNNGPNGTELDWTDPVNRRFFALIPGSDGYDLEIREYSTDRMILEQRSPDGTVLLRNIEDDRTEKVMELFGDIFPQEEWARIGAVTLYTDGVGETKSYLEPMEPPAAEAEGQQAEGSRSREGWPGEQRPGEQRPGETRTGEQRPGEQRTGETQPGKQRASAPGGEDALWELGIDLEDALDPAGNWRSETDTVRVITGLYGQLLEASMEGDYIGKFEARFSGQPEEPEQPPAAAGTDQPEQPAAASQPEQPAAAGQPEQPVAENQPAEPEVHPGAGPGETAEENLTPLEFADAFQMFVLAHKPEHMTGNWSERVGFFYGFEELTAYRGRVRSRLKLHSGAEEMEEQEEAYAGED